MMMMMTTKLMMMMLMMMMKHDDDDHDDDDADDDDDASNTGHTHLHDQALLRRCSGAPPRRRGDKEKGEGKEPSAKGAIDMLKEQRMVFNQGVKVKHGIVEALSYEVGMVMKVFESYDESMNRTIKLEVYSPNSSAKGVVNIVGGERAKRASLDEDGNTRDESREMATDIMAASTTKLTQTLLLLH